MRERSVWPTVVVAVAGVAVTVFSAYLLAGWPPEPPEPRSAATEAASPAPAVESPAQSPSTTPGSPVLAVLGDGFTAESELSPGPEWPAMLADDLGWQVEVDAVDDTGFLHAGAGAAFPDRVAGILRRSPHVVVVAGGESDLGRYPVDEVAAAADAVVGRLVEAVGSSGVVLLSPFSHGAPGPLTTELTDALRLVAEEHGVGYVDVSEWLTRGGDLFGRDPDHPLDAGQELIAENMLAELARLGVA